MQLDMLLNDVSSQKREFDKIFIDKLGNGFNNKLDLLIDNIFVNKANDSAGRIISDLGCCNTVRHSVQTLTGSLHPKNVEDILKSGINTNDFIVAYSKLLKIIDVSNNSYKLFHRYTLSQKELIDIDKTILATFDCRKEFKEYADHCRTLHSKLKTTTVSGGAKMLSTAANVVIGAVGVGLSVAIPGRTQGMGGAVKDISSGISGWLIENDLAPKISSEVSLVRSSLGILATSYKHKTSLIYEKRRFTLKVAIGGALIRLQDDLSVIGKKIYGFTEGSNKINIIVNDEARKYYDKLFISATKSYVKSQDIKQIASSLDKIDCAIAVYSDSDLVGITYKHNITRSQHLARLRAKLLYRCEDIAISCMDYYKAVSICCEVLKLSGIKWDKDAICDESSSRALLSLIAFVESEGGGHAEKKQVKNVLNEYMIRHGKGKFVNVCACTDTIIEMYKLYLKGNESLGEERKIIFKNAKKYTRQITKHYKNKYKHIQSSSFYFWYKGNCGFYIGTACYVFVLALVVFIVGYTILSKRNSINLAQAKIESAVMLSPETPIDNATCSDNSAAVHHVIQKAYGHLGNNTELVVHANPLVIGGEKYCAINYGPYTKDPGGFGEYDFEKFTFSLYKMSDNKIEDRAFTVNKTYGFVPTSGKIDGVGDVLVVNVESGGSIGSTEGHIYKKSGNVFKEIFEHNKTGYLTVENGALYLETPTNKIAYSYNGGSFIEKKDAPHNSVQAISVDIRKYDETYIHEITGNKVYVKEVNLSTDNIFQIDGLGGCTKVLQVGATANGIMQTDLIIERLPEGRYKPIAAGKTCLYIMGCDNPPGNVDLYVNVTHD